MDVGGGGEGEKPGRLQHATIRDWTGLQIQQQQKRGQEVTIMCHYPARMRKG